LAKNPPMPEFFVSCSNFSGIDGEQHWSSTTGRRIPEIAWVIEIDRAALTGADKVDFCKIICLRSEKWIYE
jgi:hypothetical protein